MNIFSNEEKKFFLNGTCQEPFVFQNKVYRMNYKPHKIEDLKKNLKSTWILE